MDNGSLPVQCDADKETREIQTKAAVNIQLVKEKCPICGDMEMDCKLDRGRTDFDWEYESLVLQNSTAFLGRWKYTEKCRHCDAG